MDLKKADGSTPITQKDIYECLREEWEKANNTKITSTSCNHLWQDALRRELELMPPKRTRGKPDTQRSAPPPLARREQLFKPDSQNSTGLDESSSETEGVLNVTAPLNYGRGLTSRPSQMDDEKAPAAPAQLGLEAFAGNLDDDLDIFGSGCAQSIEHRVATGVARSEFDVWAELPDVTHEESGRTGVKAELLLPLNFLFLHSFFSGKAYLLCVAQLSPPKAIISRWLR